MKKVSAALLMLLIAFVAFPLGMPEASATPAAGGGTQLITMLVTFGLILAVPLLLALIPANIAKRKGRRFGPWLIYGFFLFLVALIHSLCLRKGQKCPRCAEIINIEAKVCRYCGRDLQPVEANAKS